ncbi:MAG: hypothetical protein IM585_23975 [Pseudanabaena sp. M135S2SP2A07QC]|nr:hypothetical protein [Pseudanabaena sp. M110S1SP2A07QC]MCA6525470.1 hypothetical protein [Pseudanabaena sp. M179S2SP2A07QC]MCA6532213.1 hypothetical protein [Pseudanabaena sp. M125S2SP2A07QC]MCA6536151.1 hypothetical protein [Pseudanabaena sp. M176S2SP2A07QC]MCA6541364.1 hypothetical protein [Pseudanabaena sp. M037S2SP2A07QC]MCA6542015.1 hypothetical protein [Pseudanabaena sp. M074S1SP2A07QC]MCA6548664.1 hypothetical protein [Pseudanabaena sp. M152S2SP2A07QC]MCA6554929.1 hypothetical prot
MTISLELPQELEQALSEEAGKVSLPLPEYILQLLSVRKSFEDLPRSGADLVSYWQSEGLINSRPEIKDSQEYARQIRHAAEHRQHL